MKTNAKPRFQFTISGLLMATFWVAVALMPWGLAIEVAQQRKQPSDIMALAVVAGLYAPFVAIGALFGKPLLALKIAIFVVGTAIILGVTVAAVATAVLG